MENNKDVAMLAFLNDLYTYCAEIHTLLNNDVEYFKKNSFDLIDKSNQSKIVVMEKLAALANQISTAYPEGLTHQVKQSAAPDELTNMIDRLNREVEECSNFITNNSQIVFSNLQMLKEIWDKLAASNQNNLYDQSGNIVDYSAS
jgi:hypothetical protein